MATQTNRHAERLDILFSFLTIFDDIHHIVDVNTVCPFPSSPGSNFLSITTKVRSSLLNDLSDGIYLEHLFSIYVSFAKSRLFR